MMRASCLRSGVGRVDLEESTMRLAMRLGRVERRRRGRWPGRGCPRARAG
ncbi:MAG: hypothetical protein MZV49_00100 [Rhodopseudomonas palustris]|nr:hypothetical protein [Rhodopseudomonas palustris]